MPSKKRKYNARFPAGRIKKIMQTDEEVGKVAQAVPIIISRTLELFVESLLSKALQVTTTRNAKTLSPSHVKQCILGEARFDFLRDLVKNIPDVSAAEEKEFLTGDSSPNSTSRLTDPTPAPRRIAREDSNSSSSGDVIRVPQIPGLISIQTRDKLKRVLSGEMEALSKSIKIDPPTPGTSVQIDPSTLLNIPPIIAPPNILTPATHPILTPIDPGTSETAIDLSKKEPRPVRTANFYQETFTESPPHSSVIKINPIYTTPQPSTSYTSLNPVEPLRKIDIVSKPSYERHNSLPPTFERRSSLPRTPVTPITPVINIDFSKNLTRPEIKVLDATSTAASIVSVPKETKPKHLSRQNSKSKMEVKKDVKPAPAPVDIDHLNSGNLQIDEDYDT